MELICKCILLILHGLLIFMLDNSIRLRELVGQRGGRREWFLRQNADSASSRCRGSNRRHRRRLYGERVSFCGAASRPVMVCLWLLVDRCVCGRRRRCRWVGWQGG